jgi:hypothetical protein
MLDDFIRLSERLTGVAGLDRALAAHYQSRYLEHPTLGAVLPELLGTFQGIADHEDVEAQIERQIMSHPELGPAARQLIYLWYVAAFFEIDPGDPKQLRGTWLYGTDPDPYGRGLMWAVIRAHAPMTPGGAVGYWSVPPNLEAPITVPPSGWMDG